MKKQKDKVGDEEEEQKTEQNSQYGVKVVPINQVRPNPDQPRQTKTKRFREKLNELKESILAMGQLTPIMVTVPDQDGKMIIIDGERRWTAITELHREGKLKDGTIEAVFRDIDDPRDLFIMSLGANCCREDMTEIDKANSIKQLQDKGYPVHQIAKFTGNSDGWVYNMLKFLKLHPKLAMMLSEGQITSSTALYLTSYPQSKQLAILADIKKEQANKGKPLTTQELSLAVAKSSSQRGISPRKTKKGQKPLAYGPKLVRQATTLATKLASCLPDITVEILAEAGDANVTSLVQALEKVSDVSEPVKDKIAEIL